MIEEAYRTIKVRDGARNVTIPMATAVIRTLAVNAAKGNNRAALIFSNLLQTTERENKELQSQWFETAVDYKHKWDEELARRKRHGIVAEDPLPHPDDIVINPRKGTVRVLGPMTKDEKALFDAAREMMADLREGIEWSKRRLKRERDPIHRQRLLDSIPQDQALHDRINTMIPMRTLLDWTK